VKNRNGLEPLLPSH